MGSHRIGRLRGHNPGEIHPYQRGWKQYTYDVLDRFLTRTISGKYADMFTYSSDGHLMTALRKAVSAAAPVVALEPASLDPRVGAIAVTVVPEQEHPPDGRDLPPVMHGDEPEGRKIPASERPDWCKRLGSSSEVQCFRVQCGHESLVECLTPGEPPEFFGQLPIGAPVRGLHTDCGTNRESNPALILRFGGAVRPGIVLEGEITGWAKNNRDGSTDAFSMVSFVAQWYPQPTSGFYVKGGIGGAGLKTVGSDSSFGTFDVSTTNLGLQGGVGYDMHVSPGFALTPYADYLYAVRADAKLNGGSTGVNVGATMVHIGLAASWGH